MTMRQFHTLLEACCAIGDDDDGFGVQAALGCLSLITLAPMATVLVQGSDAQKLGLESYPQTGHALQALPLPWDFGQSSMHKQQEGLLK